MNFVDEINEIESRIAAVHRAICTKEIPVVRGQYDAIGVTIERLKELQRAIAANTKLTDEELWDMKRDYFS